MNGQDRLERGYRRPLAWYPRSFRRDSEDEILAVLLATAEVGQTRITMVLIFTRQSNRYYQINGASASIFRINDLVS